MSGRIARPGEFSTTYVNTQSRIFPVREYVPATSVEPRFALRESPAASMTVLPSAVHRQGDPGELIQTIRTHIFGYYYKLRDAFVSLDANKDGRVSKEEFVNGIEFLVGTSAWGRAWVATQAPKRGLPEAPPAAVWTEQQVPNALCVSCAVQIKAAPAFVQTVRHCSQCCLVAYATHPRVAHAGKRRKFNERDHAGAVLQVLQAGRGNTRSPRFRDAPRISTWPPTPMQRPSSRDPPCCDPHRAG